MSPSSSARGLPSAVVPCRSMGSPWSRSNRRWRSRSPRGSSPIWVPASSRSSGRWTAISPAATTPPCRGSRAIRLAQPLQGIADARREAAGSEGRACPAAGTSRRLRAEPGARAPMRLGFGAATCAPAYPRLIVCELYRLRIDRAVREKKAYDLLVQSEAGLVSITGTRGDALEGGHLDRRHRRRHVCLFGHPDRAAAARRGPDRASRSRCRCSKRSASGWAMRCTTRLAGRRCRGPAQPRHDCAVRSVSPARRPGRVPGHSEQPRMGHILRRGSSAGPALADARFGWNAFRVQQRDAVDPMIAAAFASLAGRRGHQPARGRRDCQRPPQQRVRVPRPPSAGPPDRWREVASPVGPLKALLPPVKILAAIAVVNSGVFPLGESAGRSRRRLPP